jgi:hypothetical protein
MTTAFSNSSPGSIADTSVIAGVVHQLRQVFTALLLGLGLVERKAHEGNTREIPGLVQRLKVMVRRGIEEVNMLDPNEAANGHQNGHERQIGA